MQYIILLYVANDLTCMIMKQYVTLCEDDFSVLLHAANIDSSLTTYWILCSQMTSRATL